MKNLIMVIASLVLAACATNSGSGQLALNTPNSHVNAAVVQDADGVPQDWTVNVDTKKAYDDCMRKFQGVETAPGICQAEADKALREGLAAAGDAVGKPFGQAGGMPGQDPIQQGYARARMEMHRTPWGVPMYLPAPPPMPQAQPAPADTKKLDATAEALKVTIRRVKDHEDRLTQIEGGK